MTKLIGGSSTHFAQRKPSAHIRIDRKDSVHQSLMSMILAHGRRWRVHPTAYCIMPIGSTAATAKLPAAVSNRNNQSDGPIDILQKQCHRRSGEVYLLGKEDVNLPWRPYLSLQRTHPRRLSDEGGGALLLDGLPTNGPPLAQFGCIGMCGMMTKSVSWFLMPSQ